MPVSHRPFKRVGLLPGSKGCCFHASLKSAPHANTAIVVLSIDESDGVVRELLQAGAITYLRKGIAPEALADALIDSISAHAGERRQRA